MPQLSLSLPVSIPPSTTTEFPDLRSYDLILMNSSGGKDSQAAFEVLYRAARAARVTDRIVCCHAALGIMEWSGVPELAAEHARFYGVAFTTVRRADGADLLDMIARRGRFPSSTNRFCTSSTKRDPTRVLMTALVARARRRVGDRQIRVLSVLGMRAQESPARRRLAPFGHDGSRTCPCVSCRIKVTTAADYLAREQAVPEEFRIGHGASNSVRHVDIWLPVHELTTSQIWEVVAEAGTRPHPAYAWGMPRLSCSFCVLASKSALVRAAQLRPELAAEIARREAQMGHTFQYRRSMAEIISLAARHKGPVEEIDDWLA